MSLKVTNDRIVLALLIIHAILTARLVYETFAKD